MIESAKAVRGVDTYYAGHRIQHAGVNYLAHIDGDVNHEADLRRWINLQDVIDDLQSASRIRLMIVDACRDNAGVPQLMASLPRKSRNVAASRGLARISNSEGTLVVFATQPNRVASDGEGRNSPKQAICTLKVKSDTASDVRISSNW